MNQNKNKKLPQRRIEVLLICCVALLCVFNLLYIRLSIRRAAPPGDSPSPTPSSGVTSPTPSEPEPADSPSVSESLDPTGSPDPSGTEAIEPGQDEPYDWEQNNETVEPGATYTNDRCFSYNYDPDGAFISVGVNTDEETDMVYLNPQASVTGFPDSKIGFYITPSRGDLVYAYEGSGSKDEGENAKHQFFVIDWAYDELTPVDYTDHENFGIGWANNFLEDGKMYEGAEIYIRAIDLSHRNRMLAAAKATIIYDSKSQTYRLAGLQSNDAVSAGELTAEESAELAGRAYDLASNRRYGPNQSIANSLRLFGTKEAAVEKAVVEFLGSRTYFPYLINRSNQSTLSSVYTNRFDDIFAVTIPVEETGFITMYYSASAPQMSLNIGDEENTTGVDISPATSRALNFFAMDFFNPETRS